MRTIKFRGKSILNGEWVYGNLVNPSERIFIFTTKHICLEVDKETVGQFRGLNDKDGNESYEGDILDFNGITVEVRFVRGVFAFLTNGNLDEELCGDCRTDMFAKVIGNIYENSDRLKGGKK